MLFKFSYKLKGWTYSQEHLLNINFWVFKNTTLKIPSNEIPLNERSHVRAYHRSLQRAVDWPLFPYYYGKKRAPIWNSNAHNNK